jgi:DUF2939 family protein
MRWTLRAGTVIAVLWLGYVAWPLWAVHDLAEALQRRDAVALEERVNFPAVRRSLTEQVVTSYLQLSGKDARLSQIGRATTLAVVGSIADPIVAQLISADALVELLQHGWPASLLPDRAEAFPVPGTGLLGAGSARSLWRLFLHSEHGLRSCEFPLPLGAQPSQQFRLQFRLTQWTWKLSAVTLPEELRLRLAQEVVKQVDRR